MELSILNIENLKSLSVGNFIERDILYIIRHLVGKWIVDIL